VSLSLDDPPRRGRPPSRNEILRGGRLAGLVPEALAVRFGTPLYVYDLDVIERQVTALRTCLPPVVDLAYAVKANPALAVVSHLGRLGLGADVASGGELATVARAGIGPERVVMTGPGKRDDELRAAVLAGIRAITVESPGELARLEAIAAAAGRTQPVLLRAAVSEDARLERVRLIGDDGAGKFGMDAADLLASAHRATASAHLELLGLHAFGASNVLDAGALVGHMAATVRSARRLAQATGTTVRLVDAGGGLGIPYEPHEASLDLGRLGAGLASVVEGWRTDPLLAGARLLLEPGRFLVGAAGAYLARVVDRKTVEGTTVVILDGGVHHVLRPVLVGQEHRVRALGGGTAATGQHGAEAVPAAVSAGSTSRRRQRPAVSPGSPPTGGSAGSGATGRLAPVTVAGPLCSGLDVFSGAAVMVPPEVGDLVAVLDVGAYGFTESMPLFLSHPIPAEVAVQGGRAELIRPRQDPGEWLERQLVPDWSAPIGGL
jgi:diaminopimelate decarboxylase